MLITQTLEKMNAMKLSGMAQAFEQQQGSAVHVALSFDERLGLLVEAEHLARDGAREMVKRKWGRIIFTGSVLSRLGRPTVPAYTATKHGVLGLTKSMGSELGRHGVTVNCIGPGFFKTELNAEMLANKEFTNWNTS